MKYVLPINSANLRPEGKPATKEKYTVNVEVSPKDKFVWVYFEGVGKSFIKTALKIINFGFVIQFLKTCLFQWFIPSGLKYSHATLLTLTSSKLTGLFAPLSLHL